MLSQKRKQARQDSNLQHPVLETGALANWSYWPTKVKLLYLGFPVQGMFSVKLAVLLELQFSLDVPLVLTGSVIPAVTLGTLEGNELDRFSFCLRHAVLSFPILVVQYSKIPLFVSMA